MNTKFIDQELLKAQEVSKSLELKPCPCCGGVNLYVGAVDVLSYGIKCNACGIKVSRGIPDRAPKGKDFVTFTLESAAMAWNKRIG